MAINDILTEVGIEGSVTTLSAPGKSIGVYNINVGSTANWPSSGKTVYFAMRTINPSAITASSPSGQIAGTYSSWKGIVGTNAITSMVLQSGSTDQTYAAGSNTQVFIPVSAARENALVTWGQVHADNLGNLKTSAVQSALGLTNLNGYTPLGATFASVVYNGNRSYTGTITGTDYTNVLSPGMRLQITRSTAAPTQSTSLNGTTQYWSKTAPNGMTFVDNFTCSGWVKLTSYPTIDGSVISRYNGTSGWVFHIVANTGQVRIGGLNSPNSKIVTTYQSIPLNKWVHIAGTLNMAGSLGNLYIDGVLAPSTISGTATSLLQVGNLEIGTYNATAFFPGQIAQAAVFSSVLSATTIQNYYSQGLLGTEPTLISAYSFNGTPNDLNSTNANNLTSNAAAGYTTSSPFSTQASGIPNGLNDFGIVQTATFSTNTTVVFQVAEGCTVPTIGGVASVVYSSNKVPYGFPSQRGKWTIQTIKIAVETVPISAVNAWIASSHKLTIPIGEWIRTNQVQFDQISTVSGIRRFYFTLSENAPSSSGLETNYGYYEYNGTDAINTVSLSSSYSATSQLTTIFYGNIPTATGSESYSLSQRSPSIISAENAYL